MGGEDRELAVAIEHDQTPLGRLPDIIRLTFDLTKKQTECFMKIREMEASGTCITNLTDTLESERSIVQKQLKVLLQKGLIHRKAVTLTEFREKCLANVRDDLMPTTNKGYLYMYSTLSDAELKKKMASRYAEWIKIMESISQQ